MFDLEDVLTVDKAIKKLEEMKENGTSGDTPLMINMPNYDDTAIIDNKCIEDMYYNVNTDTVVDLKTAELEYEEYKKEFSDESDIEDFDEAFVKCVSLTIY